MLELHVWGPAFGLPSIDAHCLAAIAYLQQAVPRGKWQLIASSDPSLSPTNELPALRNGDIWIGGFRNIFHYIAQYSAGEWVLDAGLPEQEGADCIAFSSFIESHGQPLLDLSLYVSSSNYTTVTRPTYNTILSPPLPYLIPPSLRSAAKLRTSHLGLDGLDIDTEPENKDQPSIIPQSLRNPKQSVSTLLQSSPETKARIRLDALAQNFFEPLQDLLGGKRYLVSGQQFSSLDCLALGYFTLMLIPELPQPWLSKTMRAHFPGLVAWTLELRPEIYGPPVSVKDVFLSSQPKDLPPNEETRRKWSKNQFLPWKAPDNISVAGVGNVFVKTVADSIPVIGQWRRNTRMREHGGKTQDEAQSSSWQTLSLVSSLLAGAGLVVGYLFQQGLISIGGGEKVGKEERRGLDAFGDAGAALGVYASAMDAQVQREIDLERMDGNNIHGMPVLEVDVGSEGVRTNETVR